MFKLAVVRRFAMEILDSIEDFEDINAYLDEQQKKHLEDQIPITSICGIADWKRLPARATVWGRSSFYPNGPDKGRDK